MCKSRHYSGIAARSLSKRDRQRGCIAARMRALGFVRRSGGGNDQDSHPCRMRGRTLPHCGRLRAGRLCGRQPTGCRHRHDRRYRGRAHALGERVGRGRHPRARGVDRRGRRAGRNTSSVPCHRSRSTTTTTSMCSNGTLRRSTNTTPPATTSGGWPAAGEGPGELSVCRPDGLPARWPPPGSRRDRNGRDEPLRPRSQPTGGSGPCGTSTPTGAASGLDRQCRRRTYTLHLDMSAADIAAMNEGRPHRARTGWNASRLPSRAPPPTSTAPRSAPSSQPRTPSRSHAATERRTLPFSPAALWAGHPHGGNREGLSPASTASICTLGSRVLRIERALRPDSGFRSRAGLPPATCHHARTCSATWIRTGSGTDRRFRKPNRCSGGCIVERTDGSGRSCRPNSGTPRDPSLGEKVRFDVFEPDGTYLGAVNAPADFRASINPVFDGDHVWAVTRGEFDVQRVVRYRIVRE